MEDMCQVEGGSSLIPLLAVGPLSVAVVGFIQVLRRCREQKKQQQQQQAEELKKHIEISEESSSDEEGSTESEEEGETDSSRLVYFHDKEIRCGEDNSGIISGTYDGHSVAIKYCKVPYYELVEHEITALKYNSHPNIVRYYCVKVDCWYITIATERATCNLKELIKRDTTEMSYMEYGQLWNNGQVWRGKQHPSVLLLNLMRDIISGIAHLHKLGIIHHDLRPHHVLVFKDVKDNKLSLRAKLTDMGLRRVHGHDWCDNSCRDDRRLKWRAPEHQPPDIDLTAPSTESLRMPAEFWHGQQKGDIFSLGCILFYCITEGNHPYKSDRILSQKQNRVMHIKSDRKFLSLIEGMPEALDLISHLLNHNPDMRPNAQEVLDHPFFWTSDKRLSFLRDACDQVLELEDPNIESELLNALENAAAATLAGKWDEEFDTTFLNSIGGDGSYKFETVHDSLRLIRNKFDDYCRTKFPKLFIEVYKLFCKYCKDEEFLRKYKWSYVI